MKLINNRGTWKIMRLNSSYQWLRKRRLLRRHPHLFSEKFYLSSNPDVAEANVDPISHYLSNGADEGRNPSALFDTNYYRSIIPGLPENTNPLVHFIENDYGQNDVSPTPFFDPNYYLEHNPDLEGVVDNLFVHYATYGMREGRAASPYFDPERYQSETPGFSDSGWTSLESFLLNGGDANALSPMNPEIPKAYVDLVDVEWYLEQNEDVAAQELGPVVHYHNFGAFEGRMPNPWFRPSWYRAQYLNDETSDIDPLLHYYTVGWRNGCDPSPDFSVESYLEHHTDVAAAGIEPLTHFLKTGAGKNSSSDLRVSGVTNREKTLDPRNDMDKVDDETGLPASVLSAFDAEYYACVNPDIPRGSEQELLEHFSKSGHRQGRLYASPSKARVVSSVEPRKPAKPTLHPYGGHPQFSSPLIIAGFHRSGTSLTANLFHNAGLFLGADLLGANESNPFGHFEAVEVVSFHDRLLEAAGTYWQTDTYFIPVMSKKDWIWLLNYGIRNAAFPTWGFKDPRNSLFLEQWSDVFPDMRVLYVFRPAIECVHSIKRRAARDVFRGRVTHINRRFWLVEDLAVRMYIIYASAFLRFAANFSGDLCVVELDDIIDGRDIVSEVRDHWGYHLSDAYIDDIYDSSVDICPKVGDGRHQAAA